MQELENNKEQTQLLTKFALSLKAGVLLTGNRSTCALVERPITWLNNCEEKLSPLFMLDQLCFDNIPILYEDRLQFVQPLSRQTKQTARNIPCTNKP